MCRLGEEGIGLKGERCGMTGTGCDIPKRRSYAQPATAVRPNDGLGQRSGPQTRGPFRRIFAPRHTSPFNVVVGRTIVKMNLPKCASLPTSARIWNEEGRYFLVRLEVSPNSATKSAPNVPKIDVTCARNLAKRTTDAQAGSGRYCPVGRTCVDTDQRQTVPQGSCFSRVLSHGSEPATPTD